MLKPEKSWNIDTKLNDVREVQRFLVVFESYTTCHDAGTSNAVALAGVANYDLDATSIACNLIFRPHF